MGKNTRRRPQSPKGGGNLKMARAFQEIRRSSASEPHRDRTKFNRNDERAQRQAGWL